MGEYEDRLENLLEVQLEPELEQPDESALAPPIEQWLSRSQDTELVEELAALLTGHMLAALIATGALARHEQIFHTSQQRQSFLENLRSGVLPEEDAQRRWARTLSPEQSQVLLEFTRLQASLLDDELSAMRDRRVRTSWWKSICEQRDDLESLRALVAVCPGGEDEATSGLIEALDDRAVAILSMKDGPAEFHPCVRLERATIQDPLVWWVARVAF